LHYLLRAGGAHGLHSPFVYALYNEIIRKSGKKDDPELNQLRKALLQSNQLIDIIDFKTGKTTRKPVKDVANRSLSSRKFMHFLRLLTDYLHAETVLETGTSLGLNARSLAMSETVQKVVSIEGSAIIHQLARKVCGEHPKIDLLLGDMYELLESTLERYQPEVIFLDADHRASAVQFCLDKILSHCSQVRCVVVHDIFWSSDMAAEWKAIVNNPQYTLTIDIFQAGLIFPRYPIEKQHFTLRF
jgi:predicted O-methyltransferase YrrM